MATVSLSNLYKNYGSVPVLKDVNLEFEDGEFVVLVGPSGCGKSTLLRMIAGLETITDGTVAINGQVMNALEARERDIAMVFQSYALYPHMTVAQNIGFPLRVRGSDPQGIAEQVERVAAMTGLTDLLDRKPAALSGGQRQRVAMGRAIIRSPKVFLFDEPLSNLDAKLRVQMRLQIRDLHREVGATSVYVTHDQAEAMTLADRVVLLNDGVVQQVGTPLELYESPANTFVAAFIGSPEMNLISGRVEREAEKAFVSLGDDNRISVPSNLAEAVQPGQSITIGIRPEDLTPAESGLSARFRDSEHMGSETHIFGTVGETLLTSVCKGTYHHGGDSELFLLPDSSKIHLFDGEDGARIALS